MKYSFGFIGCGNMGRAMLAGALKAGLTTPDRVAVHTNTPAHQQALAEEYGVAVSEANRALAKESEIIVSAKTKKTLDALTAMHSDLTCTLDNRQVARESEIVLLAVKPQYLHEVLTDIHDELRG